MNNEVAAGEYYEKALKNYRESYGKKHPEIGTVLNAIGRLELASGNYDEAVEFFQHALISNVSDFNETNIHHSPVAEGYYSGNTLLFSLLKKQKHLKPDISVEP